jgi:hypothetical protein
MKNDKWLTPHHYAAKIGKSRQWIYYLIRIGKIKSKKVKKEVIRLMVLDEK